MSDLPNKRRKLNNFIDDAAQDDSEEEQLDFGGEYMDDEGLSDGEVPEVPSNQDLSVAQLEVPNRMGVHGPAILDDVISRVIHRAENSAVKSYIDNHDDEDSSSSDDDDSIANTTVSDNSAMNSNLSNRGSSRQDIREMYAFSRAHLAKFSRRKNVAPPPSTPKPTTASSPPPSTEEAQLERKTRRKKGGSKPAPYDPLFDESLPIFAREFSKVVTSCNEAGIGLQYDLFILRCLPSRQKAIFRRISKDLDALPERELLHGLIAGVYTATLPGYIYLQSVNMSPKNGPVVEYLNSIHGFIYHSKPCLHTSRVQPKESRVIQSAESISEARAIRPYHPTHDDAGDPFRDTSRETLLVMEQNSFGFVGRKAPDNPLPISKTHQASLPIHRVLPKSESLPPGIKAFTIHARGIHYTPTQWAPGDWVKIKSTKKDLYNGDIGFVMTSDDRRITWQEREKFFIVAVVPRVGFIKVGGHKFKGEQRIFDIEEVRTICKAHQATFPRDLGWRHGDTDAPPMKCPVGCVVPHRGDPPCAHLTVYEWVSGHFQHGLELLKLASHMLERAPPLAPASILHPFIQSKHVDVLYNPCVAEKMPIPETWVFLQGDKVYITNLRGEQLGEGIVDGVIGERKVEIVQDSKRVSISPLNIQKRFDGGDKVVTSDKSTGSVMCTDNNWKVWVVMDDVCPVGDDTPAVVPFYANELRVIGQANVAPATHPHNFTGQSSAFISVGLGGPLPEGITLDDFKEHAVKPVHITRTDTAPWIGTQALIYKKGHPRRTYWGIVKEVKEDPDTISGLSLHLLLEDVSEGDRWAWVDFDGLRSPNNYRFIEGDPRGGPGLQRRRQFRFKPGYAPQPTPAEYSSDMLAASMRMRATALQYEMAVVEKEIAEYQKETLSLLDIPAPPEEEWLLDPRFKLSLGRLPVLIYINSGPFASQKLEQVALIVEGGGLSAVKYTDQTRRNTKKVEMRDIYAPNAAKTHVHTILTRLNHAFLVIKSHEDPHQQPEHVGKTVRRLAGDDIDRGELGAQRGGAGYIRAVEVRFVPLMRYKFHGVVEEVVQPVNIFHVHRSSIVQVYLSREANDEGNANVAELRKAHGGYI